MVKRRIGFLALNFSLLVLFGCVAGHEDYIDFENSMIGTTMTYKEPFKFEHAGELIRGDFVRGGLGLTQITRNKNGDLIYHFSVQEILSHASRGRPEWVGECLIYQIVDPETYIIKSWGFDKGVTR